MSVSKAMTQRREFRDIPAAEVAGQSGDSSARRARPKGNTNPQFERWLIEESSRRNLLHPQGYCETYIFSYPRSGNHAVRFAAEFLSKQPTLGANDHESYPQPRGLHDLPLFLRGGDLAVDRLNPIALKRHRLQEVDHVTKLILIERHPVEAVLSHTNRNGQASESDLLAGLAWWTQVDQEYDAVAVSHRLLIRFEDILSGTSDWIFQLSSFLGLKTKPEQIEECASQLPHAKKLLKRSPQTTSPRSYRDQYPRQAAFLDQALKASSERQRIGPSPSRERI